MANVSPAAEIRFQSLIAEAKRITDSVINVMDGVQNLRKAVYE